MPTVITIPILKELISNGIEYGSNLLVEFQPDSFWYETSLTIAANALGQGITTEYHCFQHMPDDVRRALARPGLDVKRLESSNVFSLIDDYSVQIGLGNASRSLEISDWSISIARSLKEGGADERGIGEKTLHIDDNTSILNRYNSENAVIDWFRTRAVPVTRTSKRVSINSLLLGAASDSFNKQVESLFDGIIEFKSQEKETRIEQYLRVRIMRGRSYDSLWRQLKLLSNGEVSLAD